MKGRKSIFKSNLGGFSIFIYTIVKLSCKINNVFQFGNYSNVTRLNEVVAELKTALTNTK